MRVGDQREEQFVADTIEIGIKAEAAVEWLESALAQAKAAKDSGGTFTADLYAQSNSLTHPHDITVSFSNDDMERDEVDRNTIYVSID
jgi:hypothetical protein